MERERGDDLIHEYGSTIEFIVTIKVSYSNPTNIAVMCSFVVVFVQQINKQFLIMRKNSFIESEMFFLFSKRVLYCDFFARICYA